jgi:hypothetical protein
MLSSHLYHSMIVLGKCHSTPVLASQIPPLQDHALFLQPRANNVQYYIKDMTLGLTPLCVLNSSSPFLVCVCSYHCLFIPLEVHVCSRGRHIYLPPNVTIDLHRSQDCEACSSVARRVINLLRLRAMLLLHQ